MIWANWSPSASVSSFFDSKKNRSTQSGFNSDMNKVLAELNRSANMLSNGADEKTFSVKFTDGRKKDFNANEFNISPDIILADHRTVKNGREYYNSLDALNGRVILGTQIRKNVTPADYANYAASNDKQAVDAYQAVQQKLAHDKIHDEWPGFRPYLDQHKQATAKSKESYQIPASASKQELDNIVNVALHNYLNPDDKISIPDSNVESLVNDFSNMLDHSWESCQNAADWLRSQLVDDSDSQEDSSSDSDKSDDSKDDKDQGSDSENDAKDDGTEAEGKEVKATDTEKPFDKDLLSKEAPKTMRSDLHDMRSDEDADDARLIGMEFRIEEYTKEQIAQKFYSKEEDAIKCYNDFVRSHQRSIKEVENCFLFEDNSPDIYSRGLSSGDIDESSLYKMRMGDYEYLYERKDINKKQKHAVGILLDLSGSMGGMKIQQARKVVMLLLEGLRSYPSIVPVVYGHTGQSVSEDVVEMVPYINKDVDQRHWLAVSQALVQNIDGTAINCFAKHILEVPDVQNRYMLIISDGEPSGDGYGGASAYKHTRNAVDRCRKNGIKTFGIGICNAFNNSKGSSLYGEGNFVVLNDTMSSLRVMVSKLKSFLSK